MKQGLGDDVADGWLLLGSPQSSDDSSGSPVSMSGGGATLAAFQVSPASVAAALVNSASGGNGASSGPYLPNPKFEQRL